MDIFRNSNNPRTIDLGIHLARYPRETRHPFPVNSIGHIRKKTDRVTHLFDTINFSFVLKGSGTYRHNGALHAVRAPCVLTQIPGVPMDYGPEEWWEELYLIYHAESMSALITRGFYSHHRPYWHFPSADILDDHQRSLSSLLAVVSEPFVVDRIDALCEMLILESLSRSAIHEVSREERLVRELQRAMRQDFLAEYDVAAIAARNGLHPATFRRHWAKYCAQPPDRFLKRIRLNEACGKLVETDQTISEIAYAVGFEDPLYFSRKFKNEFGCTATEYRRHHQSALRQSKNRGEERKTS